MLAHHPTVLMPRKAAEALNARVVVNPSGKPWNAMAVMRVRSRLA